MSKNRLLQIVNRLGLAPKDKTDLVNIINEGGTGTNENKDFDYWNLENAPISLESNHKIYKHTAEEIAQKGEIINDLGSHLGNNLFSDILFYYTLGTNQHPTELNPKYETFTTNELLNGVFRKGFKILLNRDGINNTLKIINTGVKSGYIQYQPYYRINKLPKIFYEDMGDIPILDSYDDIRYLNLYEKFKLDGALYIKISNFPLLLFNIESFMIYNVEDIMSSESIYDRYVGRFDGLGNFCVFNIDDSNINNIILQNIRSRHYTTCNIKNRNEVDILCNAEYYNGIITGIKEGKLVQYDVNFNTGEITLKRTIDLELICSEVKLDVCTAGSTEAARNLELLNKAYFALGDHFTVNIDAGIGVAKFIPETGGEGHITTAAGVNVHYTIGNDGSVVKTQEIDIVALYNKVEAMSTNE